MSAIRVGIIGCGGFARGEHIPNLKKNPKFAIHALMDLNEEIAQATAEDTGARYWTTDVDRLLGDPEVDIVFITTWHGTHAELTVKAAQAGKHILCEKPMGMNSEECRAVAAAVQKAGVKYSVGYNRGQAPIVTKARNLLASMPEKRLLYHRLQAPFPETHWTHIPEVGGGRFIGEGCHAFDLLCEFVPAPPVSVFCSGGTFLDPEKVKIPDSGIVVITFADGSVASTVIASAGCAAFAKEATEIYCAGKAIYLVNFMSGEYYGFENHERSQWDLDKIDKGWAAEIDLIADALINDTEPPNGLVKAARSAVISFKALESLASGLPLPMTERDYNFVAKGD